MLSTVLEQFQEETHSEPAVVFNFIPTLTSRLSPCTALELRPCTGPSHLGVWEKPTRGLGKPMSQWWGGQLSASGHGNGSL